MIQLKQMVGDVTKDLQREDLTLSEARDLFDVLMDTFQIWRSTYMNMLQLLLVQPLNLLLSKSFKIKQEC